MNPPGRVRRAPENFLDSGQIADVQAGRRDFLRGAFLAAAGVAAGAARAADGDPAILELPEHSKSLGQPVATLGYGQPSKHEKNLQRRESPGLTRVGGSSVSFAPLQGLRGKWSAEVEALEAVAVVALFAALFAGAVLIEIARHSPRCF